MRIHWWLYHTFHWILLFQIISARKKTTRYCLDLILQTKVRLLLGKEIVFFPYFLSYKWSQITGLHTVIYSLTYACHLSHQQIYAHKKIRTPAFTISFTKGNKISPFPLAVWAFFSLICWHVQFLLSNIFS